ncbi:MAG TPA: ABC transporter permease, partial [Pseudomonas sp.]|nr:ABC transporter permease [Pseudomonas sp.]
MVLQPRYKRLVMMGLLAFLLVACLLSLALGPVSIAPSDTLRALFWRFADSAVPADQQLIIEQIRLPRMLMGVVAGATLALTGAAMQGLFRNPLADPGLIGISSGAALGAALVIVLGSLLVGPLGADWQPYLTVPGAFVGGLACTALVYRLGQSVQGTSVASMLLAGIAITAISGALVGLLSYLADDGMLR